MVRRRFLLVAGVVAAAGLAISSQPVLRAGAQSGGGCQLQGTANFTPSLSNTARAFSYNFSGSLSSCQSNVAGAPSSGNVGAGNVVAETVTINTAVGPKQATFNYQEPTPSGSGSCGSSSTSGTGFVVWADGTRTAFAYSTTGAAAAVALQGQVTSSVVLQPLPGQGITVQVPRTVTDGVTTANSPVVTSATANFSQTDVGAAISGAGIPANATIASVQSASSATLSASATASATGVSLTITDSVFYPAPAYTWSTTRYTSADSSNGVLAFEPPDPTLCNTTGVPTAGIQGEVVIGQA